MEKTIGTIARLRDVLQTLTLQNTYGVNGLSLSRHLLTESADTVSVIFADIRKPRHTHGTTKIRAKIANCIKTKA